MLYRRQAPILRNYVSESGYFFSTLESEGSLSRRFEEEKYKRIAEMRDNPLAPEPVKKIWEDF